MKKYYLCLDSGASNFVKMAARWIRPRAKSNMGQIAIGEESGEAVIPLSQLGYPLSLAKTLLVTENAKITGKLLWHLGIPFGQIVSFEDLVRYVDGAATDVTLQGTAARHQLVYRETGDLLEQVRMMRRLSNIYLQQVPPHEVELISHTHHLYIDPAIKIDTDTLIAAQAEFEDAARKDLLSTDQVAATMGRLKRLIGMAAENQGRLPVFLNYLGTITGRFAAGGGFNFQGIPRSLPQQPAAIQQINTTIRSALKAPDGFRLLSADANAMEPRIMAWLSNDGWVKEVFDHGRSLYDDFGRLTFHMASSEPLSEAQHRLVKVIFIGLQYGAGAFRLFEMLQDQLFHEARERLLGDSEMQCRYCYRAVQCFREVCPNLVKIRREYWNAFIAAQRGVSTTLAHVTFAPKSDGVAITLPSMRKVVYTSVATDGIQRRVFSKITPGGRIEECEMEVTPTTYHSCNGTRESIYEAKLLQNLVQAIGRDLLAEMILRTEAAGIRVVGHIHDELVGLMKAEDLPHAEAILSNGTLLLPEWASGMSLGTKTAAGNTFEEL